MDVGGLLEMRAWQLIAPQERWRGGVFSARLGYIEKCVKFNASSAFDVVFH